jgi:DnaJ-class molecular chaperone
MTTSPTVCPQCNGTGNSGGGCLAASDEYGCPRCGGAGYLSVGNDIVRVLLLVALVGGTVWLLSL